jgi:hypothetical protein
MISPKEKEIHLSILLLRSEIIELEAVLKDMDRHHRQGTLRSLSRRMLIAAQRVDDLIWAFPN